MANDRPQEPKRRPAVTAQDGLRNLYRSGDESGRTKPDEGEAFAGLKRRKNPRDWDRER